jgi:hypothetical protein
VSGDLIGTCCNHGRRCLHYAERLWREQTRPRPPRSVPVVGGVAFKSSCPGPRLVPWLSPIALSDDVWARRTLFVSATGNQVTARRSEAIAVADLPLIGHVIEIHNACDRTSLAHFSSPCGFSHRALQNLTLDFRQTSNLEAAVRVHAGRMTQIVTATSTSTGFGTIGWARRCTETMRRAFRRVISIGPGEYPDRFRDALLAMP